MLFMKETGKGPWKGEIAAYLRYLRGAGKSKNYIAGAESVLNFFGKRFPDYSLLDPEIGEWIDWFQEVQASGIPRRDIHTVKNDGTTRKQKRGRLKVVTMLGHYAKVLAAVRYTNRRTNGVRRAHKTPDSFPSKDELGWDRNLAKHSRVKSASELYTEDEIRNLAVELPSPSSALFLVTMGLGCRPTEALTMERHEVNEYRNGFAIDFPDTKTGYPRTAHLAQYGVGALRVWLDSPRSPKEGFIFPSPTDPTRALSVKTYRKTLKAAAKRLGMTKNVYPYLARHTRITSLLREGINVKTIKAECGIKTDAIIDNYAHLLPEDHADKIFGIGGNEPMPTPTDAAAADSAKDAEIARLKAAVQALTATTTAIMKKIDDVDLKVEGYGLVKKLPVEKPEAKKGEAE